MPEWSFLLAASARRSTQCSAVQCVLFLLGGAAVQFYVYFNGQFNSTVAPLKSKSKQSTLFCCHSESESKALIFACLAPTPTPTLSPHAALCSCCLTLIFSHFLLLCCVSLFSHLCNFDKAFWLEGCGGGCFCFCCCFRQNCESVGYLGDWNWTVGSPRPKTRA